MRLATILSVLIILTASVGCVATQKATMPDGLGEDLASLNRAVDKLNQTKEKEAEKPATPRYKHESKISPDVFMAWEIEYSDQVVIGGEIMFFIIGKNPDPTAEIQKIESIYHSSGMLVAFGYIYRGEVWVFRWSGKTNTYEQTQPEKPETLNVQEPQKKPSEG